MKSPNVYKSIQYPGKSEKSWGWIDKWPMDYTRWGSQAPIPDGGDCAYVAQNNTWINAACSEQKPFVCKVLLTLP